MPKSNGHIDSDDPDLAELYEQPKKKRAGVYSIREKLEGKYRYHVERAQALKLVLDMLDEEEHGRKQSTVRSTLQRAMQIDEERRVRKPEHKSAENTRARRQRTAELLATFNRTTPKAAKGTGIGALVQAGLLRRKGLGYIRTAKPFDVNRISGKYNPRTRQRTGERLAKMSTTEPRHYGIGAGILTLHGYLARQGKGWIRTDKPWVG